MQINRRRLLSYLATGSATLLTGACSPDIEPHRYTQDDKNQLTEQQQKERIQSGRGPFGRHVYHGYRGLAELPWFALDNEGQLYLTDDSVPDTIDVHCHLGMSLLFEPELDLLAKTPRVKHLLDADAQIPGTAIDLDVYINSNFSKSQLSELKRTLIGQAFLGNKVTRSHTIPNLMNEMNQLRVKHAVLLPLDFNLPFGNRMNNHWHSAVQKGGYQKQFESGFSVHPLKPGSLREIEEYARQGARVLKLHPTMQRFFPDDLHMMEVYSLARDLGLTIFFHGGRAGIETPAQRPYALPRHYAKAFAGYPGLNFIVGHAGARDHIAMLELALTNKNVWLGLHGQSLTQLDRIIQATGGERLLFGSDWPFYHIASSLAKILIVTENASRRSLRQSILWDNALDVGQHWGLFASFSSHR